MTSLTFHLDSEGEQLDLESDDSDAYDYRRWIDDNDPRDDDDDDDSLPTDEASAASIAEAELEAELLQEMSKLDESTPRPQDEEESEEE